MRHGSAMKKDHTVWCKEHRPSGSVIQQLRFMSGSKVGREYLESKHVASEVGGFKDMKLYVRVGVETTETQGQP